MQSRRGTANLRVGRLIREAIESQPRPRRHPAQVTSDRLAEARERWLGHFTAEELGAISRIRDRLESIADKQP